MLRLVIITGASRGIGAAAALEFNEAFDANTKLILMARDFLKLTELKTQIDIMNADRMSNNTVNVLQIDFSNFNLQVKDYVDSLLSVLDANIAYDELYVLYNHGTLEHSSIIENAENNELHRKFETNFFSIWNVLSASQILMSDVSKQTHVNINSSYAINAAASWSVQCCCKRFF
jgi:NADP-dependent 3-hydroxy acid dehydrogenase YdfG